MPTIQETLANCGFEPSVANIYLILAQNGELSVSQIIEKTGLSRAGAYDALNILLSNEYIEHRKEGRNVFYKIYHPSKLFQIVEERKREDSLFEKDVAETVKTLVGSYNLSNNKPGVRFFEGEEGMREATFDSLKATGTIYTFLDVDATQKFAGEMNKEYVKERIKRKIFKKQISLDTPFTRERYRTLSPADRFLEVRLLPAGQNPFQTGLQIYNNTISYSTLTADKKIGVIIEDESIARMQKSLFEYIWKSLPPLPASQAASLNPAVGV